MASHSRENGRALLSEPLYLTIESGDEEFLANADLLAASDTGMFDDDNVTAKWSPAFQGVAPVKYKVRLYANGELVGQTHVGSDSSDVGVGGVVGRGVVVVVVVVDDVFLPLVGGSGLVPPPPPQPVADLLDQAVQDTFQGGLVVGVVAEFVIGNHFGRLLSHR